MKNRLVGTAAILELVVAVVVLVNGPTAAPAPMRDTQRVVIAAPPSTTAPPPPPTEPPTTTTVAPTPSTPAPTAPRPTVARRVAPPRTTVTAAPAAAAPRLRSDAPLVAGDVAPFRGFGAWIDVYDWSREFGGSRPAVGPADVDRMADLGVQALYVQAAKQASANDVVDLDLLRPIIDRAHQRGLRVIVWYLPTLEDPARDLQRLIAIAGLGVEGVGVDIEGRQVSDVAERNRRLVDLSIALRQRLPGVPLAAIIFPAVVMEVINPNFWPDFPYRDIAPAYDLWMPMDYWTNRKPESGYRDAYRYTAENIDRLRAQVGRADLPVHAIGGIGDKTTVEDLDGFRRASVERGALGGSIYDYRTTRDELWPHLQPFRS